MFQTIINAWKVADLRKKILFTALILLIFRIGSAIPVPFINITDGIISASESSASFLNYLALMAGEAFNYGTLFAMSVTPYINASIIIQLLTVAIPALERLSKEGEEGRKKINKITRYFSLALAALQSTAYFVYLRSRDFLTLSADGTAYTGFWLVFQAVVVIFVLTAGTALVMWLGEQINDKGIGNGISMILFAGILSRIPATVSALYENMNQGGAYFVLVPIAAVSLLLMVVFIVWMDNAEHRIPVQYAKRVVGRKMYGGQSSHIPLKVNMSGVLPVIFAGSILSLPPTIEMFVKPATDWPADSFWGMFFGWFQSTHWVYAIIYFILIIFFAYFYSAIQYNPIEMANNIRKNSGAIPGIRPGKPTSDYIMKVMSKITLLGALLLSVIALFPIIFGLIANALERPVGGLSIGGTSIIIMVGVALETVRQLESQMMMRHYKGFLD
ncbi:MAG: preprotein translocase subunit SecY [Oscillospiraceae bacterium]|jgi:preprotein translocase subunit SecY|nr:preprotein translocase subunit SecY [Oscillospiraceae bacterium]